MNQITAAKNEVDDWREGLQWYTHTTIVPRFLKLAGLPLFKLIMRAEAIDIDKLPLAGPCILAANHISGYDVMVIGLYLPRYPFYMAKEEIFFKNSALSWIYRVSGAFPLKRHKSDPWAMKQAGTILQACQMLAIFPEGTRGSRQGQLRRGKPGAVMLALEYNVPIVPVAILGTQNVSIGRARPRVTVQVGEPLDATTMAGPPPHRPETIRDITTTLMQRIAAMLPPDYRGVYA